MNVKNLWQELILEFQRNSLPKLIYERDIELVKLPNEVRKAHVFMGIRRSGKTYLMYQFIKKLIEQQNISINNIIYINGADDRLLGITEQDTSILLESYYELYPDTYKQPNIYFFIDEVHELPGWEKTIRRFLDQEFMQLYITGSSAKLLSKEIATALRGRTINYEVFPLSYSEYIRATMPKLKTPYGIEEKIKLKNALNTYLTWGGFPEIIYIEETVKRSILQGYVNTVLYRDVVERYSIKNLTALHYFLNYCLQNPATLINIQKIYKSCVGSQIHVGKNAFYEYAEYFADAFAFSLVSLYHFSYKHAYSSSKKIYLVDPGLITAYTTKYEWTITASFENIVFLYLRNKYVDQIFYYKTKSDKEVDFLVNSINGILLVQASVDLSNLDTKNREINALCEACQELNLKKGFIITLDNAEQEITINDLIITIIPFWSFAIKNTIFLSLKFYY